MQQARCQRNANTAGALPAGSPHFAASRSPVPLIAAAKKSPTSLTNVLLFVGIAFVVQSCASASTSHCTSDAACASEASKPLTTNSGNPDSKALSFEDSVAGAAQPTEKPGLPVGAHAPPFTLESQFGRAISLESLLEKGPVALVFYRSADWCLFCKMQSVQLQNHLAEFEAAGGQIVGISYDPVEILKRFADRSGITYPLLSDAGSKTIDAYGVRHKNAGARDGVAYHSTFILDQAGVIRSKLFQVSYAERPAVDNLVRALKEARLTSGGSH